MLFNNSLLEVLYKIKGDRYKIIDKINKIIEINILHIPLIMLLFFEFIFNILIIIVNIISIFHEEISFLSVVLIIWVLI